jgi:hypothetical protein
VSKDEHTGQSGRALNKEVKDKRRQQITQEGTKQNRKQMKQHVMKQQTYADAIRRTTWQRTAIKVKG